MTSPVDDYLAGVAEPGRSTLESVRRTIAELLPDATEALACGAELGGYEWSKGALRFSLERALPESLLRVLLQARLAELGIDRPL